MCWFVQQKGLNWQKCPDSDLLLHLCFCCLRPHRYTLAAQDLLMRSRGVLKERGWRLPNDRLGSGDDITVFVIPLAGAKTETWQAPPPQIRVWGSLRNTSQAPPPSPACPAPSRRLAPPRPHAPNPHPRLSRGAEDAILLRTSPMWAPVSSSPRAPPPHCDVIHVTGVRRWHHRAFLHPGTSFFVIPTYCPLRENLELISACVRLPAYSRGIPHDGCRLSALPSMHCRFPYIKTWRE